MKKVLSLFLVGCMMMTMASFPATAAATNPKRVKIFTMGDSFTAGICEPNAYRYYIYENLIQDGGVFEFIGPNSSGDYRVTSLYNKHGGVGGAIIGCADDYKWNGSGWVNNAWSTVSNGITIKSNGNRNSIHYRLFAGSDGSNNYTKTEYGNYVKDADIVVLYIGLNDYYSTGSTGISADIEHVKQRYYTIVDRIFEINPNVSLYVCSLNVVDYLRGYNLNPGDSGYEHSVFKYNEFILNDVVNKYTNSGKKITGVSLNQPGYEMIVGVDNPSDDAHPNEKGNRKIGTQIYMALKDEVIELNKQTGATYNPTRVTSITLDKTAATLKTGENLTLTSTIAPSDPEIITTIFSSSDESVATVDGYGRVTAVGEGTATIYATALDSMRPEATELKVACNVTVTSDDYVKMGDNFLPVLAEDFSTTSAWTGSTDYIKGKAYKHKEDTSSSSITTKRTFDLREGFSISFKAALMGGATSEVNATSRNSQNVSVKIGNYELRISVCGKVVSFYYNGSLVKERIFNTPAVRQNDDRYTLTKYEDTVYVYRNNELLFTSEVNLYDTAEGQVTLSVNGTGSKNIRDLKVTSIYGLQKLEPTAKNGTTNASAAVDGSTSTRFSIESGKNAVPAVEWTGAKNNVILDLGAIYSVSDLNIYWGAYSGGAWGKTVPDEYNISYSEDGITYTPAKSYSGIHAYIKGEASDTISGITTSFSASHPTWTTGNDDIIYSYGVVKEAELGWENVRYVKIEMTKVCYNPTIAEVEVYTTSYAPGEEPEGTTTEYTVNYVDTQGNTLAPSKTGSGFIGGRVTEKAADVKGYLPDQATKIFTLEEGENVITFVYTLVPEKLPLTGDNIIDQKGWGWNNNGKIEGTKDVLFDGETATNTKAYLTHDYLSTSSTLNHYIEIDLGAVYDLSHIVIQGGSSDYNYAHFIKYEIYTAGEDKVYDTIPAGKHEQEANLDKAANKVRTDTVDIKTNDVRYVKIVPVTASRRPCLGEIEIYRSMEANAEKVETSYTVNYVDEKGNAIAEAKTEVGFVGDEVIERPVTVAGYIANDESKTITLVDGTNTITFTYTAKKVVNYTVNYVDTEGKVLATAKNGTGYVDDKVTENYVSVDGYVVDKTSETITLVDGTNTITFTYTKVVSGEPVPAILTFVSAMRNGAAKSPTSSTSTTPEKATDKDTSTGYLPNDYFGSYTTVSQPLEIIFKLEKAATLDSLTIDWGLSNWGYNSPDAYAILVSKDGSEYKQLFSYTNLYDKTAAAEAYKGFSYTAGAANSGNYNYRYTMTETDINTNDVLYIKIAVWSWIQRSTIAEIAATTKEPDVIIPTTYTVNYVDDKGNVLVPSKTVTDKNVGNVVTETAPEVEGYLVDEATKTLTLINGENTINFVYSKINYTERPDLAGTSLGSQIRLPAGSVPAGLRFAATIQKAAFGADAVGAAYDLETLMAKGIKVGMFIIPANLLGANGTVADYVFSGGDKALNVLAAKVYAEDDETVTFTAVLTNIPETDYSRDVIAAPYLYIDGEYIFYSEMTKNYASVAEAVAQSYEKGEITLTADKIAVIESIIGRTLAKK